MIRGDPQSSGEASPARKTSVRIRDYCICGCSLKIFSSFYLRFPELAEETNLRVLESDWLAEMLVFRN